ncbi:MAG: hypothetical protein C5B51_02980 [Terriglobia bacterium]|nr:MAG: hypothetical protein C5B51_02980 [Terriglobia bacterium]
MLCFSLVSCSVTPPEVKERKVAASKGTYVSAHGKSATLKQIPDSPLYALEILGNIDSPLIKQPVPVAGAASVYFTGWAVEQAKREVAAGVDVTIDGHPYTATYGVDRPDVAVYLKIPACRKSGFNIRIPVAEIGEGLHIVTIRVLSTNGAEYQEGVPIRFDVM